MTDTPVPTTLPVPVARVLDALRDAGLLVAQAEHLPATLTDLVDDSRRVSPGSAFLAVKGAAQDGHAWLPAAAERGATLALVETPEAAVAAGLPWVQVRDGRRAAAIAAATAAAIGEHRHDPCRRGNASERVQGGFRLHSVSVAMAASCAATASDVPSRRISEEMRERGWITV